MQIYETNFDLSSPEYIANTERFLTELASEKHSLAKAVLHGKAVYIVTDVALAKEIFADSENFSFTPNVVESAAGLTEGAQAFMQQGLESALLDATADSYKSTRRLFNQAFKRSFNDRAEVIAMSARSWVNTLRKEVQPPQIDALALCRRYWLPLAADVIGVSALSFAELELMAHCSRKMVEANGLQGDPESVSCLAKTNAMLVGLIQKVVDSNGVSHHSALEYFLDELDRETAIDFTRTFVLAGIDTGSSALGLQTYLLAANPVQQAVFLQLSEAEQQEAVTELASKEAPTLYTPRFAVRDVTVRDFAIPAGSFVQLALYPMNRCANPDFDVRRPSVSGCPLHSNETLPFGYARHKCPGESMARHLFPLFLSALFSSFRSITINSFAPFRWADTRLVDFIGHGRFSTRTLSESLSPPAAGQ